VAGELLSAALTGRAGRDYDYLESGTVITLKGNPLSLEAMARAYQPQITMDSQYMPPNVVAIWYQAVSRDDAITFVYYLDWENEIHPQPVVHWLYEVYRRAVYGSEHDIEYVEITVDTRTGDVEKVRYETSPAGIYNRDVPVHLVAVLEHNTDWTGYQYTVRDRDSGELLSSDTVAGIWNAENPVTLAVFTWNHLYTLRSVGASDDHADVAIEAPLRYLTDAVFAQYQFARRSQGDVATAVDETGRHLLRFLIWGAGAAVTLGLWRKGRL
jgi:hypothetical protein